jgi:integrase
VRHLALPKSAAAALRAHRAAQAAEQLAAVVWVDPGLVFTDDLGRPLLDKSARRRMLDWWHRLCRQAKIPGRRMYASRHTAATLMLNDGVPLELVSATLGHASLAITMDTYATVGPVLQRKAADAMDRRFGG